MLPKCPHGVYVPGGRDGEKSPYCSGCTPPDPLPPGGELGKTEHNPFPYGEKKCPVCDSKKFRYNGEWDWHCYECGSDALDG